MPQNRYVISSFCIILVSFAFAAKSFAFVNRLGPYGGPVLCHDLAWMFEEYAEGFIESAQFPDELRNLYGITWTSIDLTDIQNLLGQINNTGTGIGNAPADVLIRRGAKARHARRLERLCGLAERGYAAVDTPNKFRARIGIPTQ